MRIVATATFGANANGDIYGRLSTLSLCFRMHFAGLLDGIPSGFSILVMLLIFLVGALIERLAPAQNGQPLSHTIFNVGYALVAGWFTLAAAPILGIISTTIVNDLGGGLIELPGSGWPLIASMVVYLLVIDFMEFAFHRAQHAWLFLWAMHSFHHSDPSVNITTTFRNYWLEAPIKAIFVYPIVAILFKVPPAVLVIYGISTIWHYVNHLNVRWRLPIPWQILNNPHYHRIHHSTRPEHYNKNFSPYFPIWDILGGTAHPPQPDEYPQTGLDNGDVPENLLAAAIWPVRARLKFGGHQKHLTTSTTEI